MVDQRLTGSRERHRDLVSSVLSMASSTPRRRPLQFPGSMHVRFWILAVVVVSSVSLPLEGAYRLVFELDGKEHTVKGVEKSKPYYIEDGGRRFLHAAERVRVNPGPDASPFDFFYPIDYGIEKVALIPEHIKRLSRYRISFELRGFRSQQVRYFHPERLLALWPREKIQEGFLALLWLSSGNLEFLDMAQIVAIEKPESISHTLSGGYLGEFVTGYPAIGLFVGGVSIPPRYAVQDPQDLSILVAAYRGTIERTIEGTQLERVRNFRDLEGNSLLHIAAANGHQETVRFLLEGGMKPTLRNIDRATPIHLAAERGRGACVRGLLSAGGKMGMVDKYNGNALHYAIRFGHEEVASLLLDSGISPNNRGFYGYYPIALALNHNRGRILEKLVRRKARWDADREDMNRLLIGKSGIGENRLVRYLISRGARADQMEMGTTALIAAMRYTDEEMLELLLEARADVNQATENGVSPLMRASLWANEVAVEWLLKNGADVNHTAPSGESALSLASRYHHAEVVRRILAHGADVNLANSEGFTPLELATLHGDRSIVQELIEAGATCDLTEEKALLLMNYAFRNNIPEFVEIALSDCLSEDFLFHNRFSPMWVAKYYGHKEIIDLFGGGNLSDREKRAAKPSFTRTSKLARRPQLLDGERVAYPAELSEKYGDQTVRVQYLISEDGRTLFPKAVSGDIAVLNQLAMNAVGRWKFEPPRARGKRVLVQYSANVRFLDREREESVFELAELDTDPRLISTVRPVYPHGLKVRGVEGYVRLIIVVDKEGNVRKARGQRFSHPDFVQPAIDAVLQWKYEPGYKDGVPVKVRRIQPISFRFK